MPAPDPAVAAVRRAVRAALAETPPGSLVAAAVSGGADSLALLAALAHEAPRDGRRAAAVTVDHGLHPTSAEQAATVVAQAASLGVGCAVLAVTCRDDEASARAARYAALDEWAAANAAAAVLLGHTRDDQSEQVLLGLARGSGARSLAGMPPARGVYRRPLLDLPRATTRAACAALGLDVWEDPANADFRHARVRVRTAVLPVMEQVLGPGVGAALARSAKLLRDDADALDALAAAHTSLAAADLAALPRAVRTRVLRRAAITAGAPATDLTADHVASMDALVTAWRGQGAVALPGGLEAERRCDTLAFRPSPRGDT